MTHTPRVTLHMRRARHALPLAAFILLTVVVAPAFAQRDAANPDAASLAGFQARMDAYLELRASLSGKLKSLSVTTESAELTARQESLAVAMRTARKDARQGDLIPPDAARRITSIVRADFKRRRAAAEKATLKEVPNLRPVINKVYPAPEALPTMPPLLLNSLPRLPDNLQYRYYGRSVVLLDGDLEIIVDYIPDVLPPH